ncbi:MAG: ATP phosphoribosyltransferase [Candidatus Pacebacteria bacterium]|nr:ATP phosphoribosyltransferase [Candidatus Paceibacterota bacterium]
MPTKKTNNKLRLGVPARALRFQVLELLERAGFTVNVSASGHKINIDDPEIECFFSKTQELAEWVENGMLDAAIVQKARIIEQGIKAKEIGEFKFGNGIWDYTRVVVAVPQTSKFKSIKDLQNQEVFSRLPNITRKFFEQQGVKVKITRVTYPGEAKAEMFDKPLVDFTNTGRTLREHNLRVLEEIMQTSPRLIMNNEAYKDAWKRQKAENLFLLLSSARLAMDMIGLMLHVKGDIMPALLDILPAMKKPTVTQLRGENMFDVLTVIDRKEARELVPRLKKIGCTDIVEFPLEKVVI